MTKQVKYCVLLAVSLIAIGALYQAEWFGASPVVLFASYDSGVGGSWLELRANGTFDYTSAGLFSETVTHGHYTQADSLIRLDRLPKNGVLRRNNLVVRTSPAFETGQGLWQLGPTGRVDTTLPGFNIFRTAPVK